MRGDLELIAHADREHAERARWAARLAPKNLVCCHQASQQGRKSPARATALDTENSDGSSAGHAADELLDDTGLLICQGLALLIFIVSALIYTSLWL